MNISDRVIDLATQIQQIPAATFDEKGRAEMIRDHFQKENLCDVELDSMGNVFARLPGDGHSSDHRSVSDGAQRGQTLLYDLHNIYNGRRAYVVPLQRGLDQFMRWPCLYGICFFDQPLFQKQKHFMSP